MTRRARPGLKNSARASIHTLAAFGSRVCMIDEAEPWGIDVDSHPRDPCERCKCVLGDARTRGAGFGVPLSGGGSKDFRERGVILYIYFLAVEGDTVSQPQMGTIAARNLLFRKLDLTARVLLRATAIINSSGGFQLIDRS